MPTCRVFVVFGTDNKTCILWQRWMKLILFEILKIELNDSDRNWESESMFSLFVHFFCWLCHISRLKFCKVNIDSTSKERRCNTWRWHKIFGFFSQFSDKEMNRKWSYLCHKLSTSNSTFLSVNSTNFRQLYVDDETEYSWTFQ